MRLHRPGYIHNALMLMVTLLIMGACSSGKNTWRERVIQSLNTRYNVYFNGKKSYDEGLKAMLDAHKDDYSKVIPMYPISVHSNASAATSQMTRTIEKARKAIKNRSIKTKPEVSSSKRSDPKTKAFLQQEEYNPFMKEVWLLLAKAEFHKADFLGSVGTFNYIIRHFKEDRDLQVTCQLWVVRAYAELGWLYEAEEMLRKLNPSEIRNENTGLFAAVQADLLLKQKHYREAIPFVELALKWEKDKQLQTRFSFLLAQLYNLNGDRRAAYDAYSRIIDSNPPYEMDLNARINRATLFLQKTEEVRRDLEKMVKNNNNKEYLDQLYHTIGLSYLHDKDTLNAIASFEKAAEESTRNGIDKATTLIRMADVLYERKSYVKAQPAYDEASKIITIEHDEYSRVSKRSEMLAELVVEHEMVMLQDSLQRLSAMNPEQRLETIKKHIAWLEAEEKRAAEREAAKQAKQEENAMMEPSMGMPPIGGGWNQGNEWYFYNPQSIRSGQQEFQRRWGKRKLEDNWRRMNKSAALFSENQEVAVGDSLNGFPADSQAATTLKAAVDTAAANPRNPEFYLKQIPETPAQIEKSNELWAEALFNMGQIYKDKLEDFPMAIVTFDEYVRRFSSHPQASDALFNNYLVYQKMNQALDAERSRQRLIQDYPETRYAQLLSDPDFLRNRQLMFEQQDSLYQLTYAAFNANEFARVKALTDSVRSRFPMSTLMPKFLFLRALGVAKTGDQQAFEKELNALLEEFPQSDVSAMSKDMLALMKQGRESQQGGSHGSILARREAELVQSTTNDSLKLEFSSDRKGPHRLVLLSSTSQEDLFPLQFQLAVYNFSKFLIKDFEIVIAALEPGLNEISIFDFDDHEETEWYLQSVREDSAVSRYLENMKVEPVVISSYNYSLLRSGKKLNDYKLFKEKELNPEDVKQSVQPKQVLPQTEQP